jgi:outer membrane protein TolC
LNLLLDRPLEQDLTLSDVDGTPPVPGDADSDMATALGNRPDARKARLGLERQEISVKGAWAALLPALTVGASLGYRFDEPTYTIAPGVTVAGTNPYYQASAVLSVPIFDGFARWQDVRDSKLALDAQREDWRGLLRKIASDLLNARQGLEQSRRSYELARDETQTAQEELDILLDQYRDGRATAVQIRDSRNDLLQLEQAQATSLYQYYIGRAQLLEVSGTLLPDAFGP